MNAPMLTISRQAGNGKINRNSRKPVFVLKRQLEDGMWNRFLLVLIVSVFFVQPAQNMGEQPESKAPYIPTNPISKTVTSSIFIPAQKREQWDTMLPMNGIYPNNVVYDENLDEIVRVPNESGFYYLLDGKLSCRKYLDQGTTDRTPTSLIDAGGKRMVAGSGVDVNPYMNTFYNIHDDRIDFYLFDKMELKCSEDYQKGWYVLPISYEKVLYMNYGVGFKVIDLHTGKVLKTGDQKYLAQCGNGLICAYKSFVYDAITDRECKLADLGLDNYSEVKIKDDCVDFYIPDDDGIGFKSCKRLSRVDGTVENIEFNGLGKDHLIVIGSRKKLFLFKDLYDTLLMYDAQSGKVAWTLKFEQPSSIYDTIILRDLSRAIVQTMGKYYLIDITVGKIIKDIPRVNLDRWIQSCKVGNKIFYLRQMLYSSLDCDLLYFDGAKAQKVDIPFKLSNSMIDSSGDDLIVCNVEERGLTDKICHVKYAILNAKSMELSKVEEIDFDNTSHTGEVILKHHYLFAFGGIWQKMLNLKTGKQAVVVENPKTPVSDFKVVVSDNVIYAALGYKDKNIAVFYSFEAKSLQRLAISQSVSLSPGNKLPSFYYADDNLAITSALSQTVVCDCNGKITKIQGQPVFYDDGQLYVSLGVLLRKVDLATFEQTDIHESYNNRWVLYKSGNDLFDGNKLMNEKFEVVQTDMRLSHINDLNGKLYGWWNSGQTIELKPCPIYKLSKPENGLLELSNLRADGLADDLSGHLVIYGSKTAEIAGYYTTLQEVIFDAIKQGETRRISYDDKKIEDFKYLHILVFSNGVYRNPSVIQNSVKYFGGFLVGDKTETIWGGSFVRQDNQ